MIKNDLAVRIKTMRLSRGLTQAALAEYLKCAPSTISMYERGEREPDFDSLEALADVFNVPLSALLMGEDEAPQRPLLANLKPITSMHRQKVPLIGRVAAGQPIMAEEDYETFVDAPIKCDCALEVDGDSMEPLYKKGDILYIQQRPDVSDGQIAVVLLDDSATLKHVYHDKNGLTLISENPAYAPIIAHDDEYSYIAIYGVPVGYTRMYKHDILNKIKKGMR